MSIKKEINVKKKSKLQFKIIAIILPFLLLSLIEIILRIFNYGYNTQVILEDKDHPEFCYLNPDLTKKFFTSTQLATTGNKDYFKKIKDKNTFRFFVLGESSALGFPYNHNGSISRMLKYRLERSYQDINFDVINCAMVGVNSYTILDIAKGLTDYQPDAIIIYMGHNEYYGALGVGSTNRIGRNRNLIKTAIYLRRLRIFQSLMKLRENIVSLLTPETGKFKNRMERMADKDVIFGSELYQDGIKQFDENLNETLKLFKNHKIPVFIGNIVSNEKDQMPFASQTAKPHNNDEWYNLYVNALEYLKTGEKEKAYNALKRINEIDSSYATAQFFEGQLEYEQGKFPEAKKCFINAKELDIIRFRAPEKINTVIKQQAKYFSNYFVDIKKSFEEKSKNGIIGKELILEHLHPNIDGYFLIAENFFKALNESKLIKSDFQDEPFEKIRRQYPITPVDSLRGLYEIYMLKESWPFNEQIPDSVTSKGSEIAQIAGGLSVNQYPWIQAMTMLNQYYIKNNDKKGQLMVNEAFALEYPFEFQYFFAAGKLSDETGDFERSAFYFKKAFYLNPTFDNAKKAFLLYLKLDEPQLALEFIDYAIQNNSSSFDMKAFKKLVEKTIELKEKLRNNPYNEQIIKEIAMTYNEMGNNVGRDKYLQLIQKKNPSFITNSK